MLRKSLCLFAALVIFSCLAELCHATNDLSSFSVFATNSIWLRQGATIKGGDIGVRGASPGPWLNSQSEVTIGKSVILTDGSSLYADTVKIKMNASVDDVHYNELTNNGTIRGNEYTPLPLPLDISLPDFPIPTSGTKNHNIPRGQSLELGPGVYGEIQVRANATLILTGGTYHFENLDLGYSNAKVLFQAPTDLIINNRLEPGQKAVIGPAEGSNISARDIRIYVNGINGTSGNLRATPKAATIGYNNTFKANIYAPNGTILIKPGSVAEGAFIGKDVKIGLGVQVAFNSGFGQPTEVSVPEDLDYGFNFDEQQGGGGLVGDSIRILNGNHVERRLDLNFSSSHRMGFAFESFYNSRSVSLGILGFGWTHTYSVVLAPAFAIDGTSYIKIVNHTGRATYFQEDEAGVFKGIFQERSYVSAEAEGYIWHPLDGSQYGFSATGRLMWINDEKGNRLTLSYGAEDRLQTVADTTSGRTLTFNYNADGKIESISGPTTAAVFNGIWITYAYDDNDNLTSVTYPDGSGFTYDYTDPTDVHNLTEKRNKAGHLMSTWGYDDQDRCTASFSVQGKGVTIEYVSDTQVDVTDAYGALRTYTIATIGDRKRVTAMQGPADPPYADDNAVRWQYDSELNLVEVEYANGSIHQYGNFDALGNPQTVILAAGDSEQRTINYTYHPDISAPLTRSEPSVLGAGSKVTIWDFDDDYDATPNENPTHLVSRIVEQGFTKDATGQTVAFEYVSTFTYNAQGQVLSIDGPRTDVIDVTSFAYYDNGDLEQITRPLIGTTAFNSYDNAGEPGRIIDVNNQSIRFAYDGRGRITTVFHDADGSALNVVYDIAGSLGSTRDEDSVTKDYEYDFTYGRLYRVYDMDGNYIQYLYDVQGNRIEKSKHDPTGLRSSRKRWDFQYPSIPGKLWKEINADNTYIEYQYDAAGNLAAITDAEFNTTGYAYDPLNRLITVTQPGNAVTAYTYDKQDNLTSVTDAEGHVTTYSYDDIGRVVSISSADTGTTTYAYDEAGDAVQKTDANSITTQYGYDVLNRLTVVVFPDSSQNITYTYDEGADGNGRRTGMTDPSGSTTFGYDSRGRLVVKTGMVNGYAYAVTRAYTPGSRLSSITYPSGRSIDYTRYLSGKIQRVSTTFNANTITLADNIDYNPFGRPQLMTTGFGSTVNNQSGECDCLEVINPGEPMEQVYAYDANRNLTTILATNMPWLDQMFSYDALGRLQTAAGSYGSISYTYDKVGNRLTRTIDGQTDTYSYTAGTNKLDQISGAHPATFTYDANGNIIGIDTKTLIYNQNNRLVQVQEDGIPIADYTYNALGQRVLKDAEGITTVFHYDFDGNVIAESLPDGTFTAEYLHLASSRLAKVEVSTDTFYYYLNNYLGTPVIMTDDTGMVIWEAEYKPFGEVKINPNSEVVNNFRFAGQYFDEETGLHYNYHRYYDPKTGRYLTPDPIGLEGGINPFLYAAANPINATDPFGLEIRVYSSDAFGVPGLNHSFVYSTELMRGIGRAGKSGSSWGDGVGDLNSPYVVVENLNGLSESEFMRRIENYPGWNSGAWCPWLDDCHSELADAFEYTGVPYPGAPNDRIDIDDVILNTSRQIWRTTFEWFDEFFSDDDSCN